jgi:hypothetical protein
MRCRLSREIRVPGQNVHSLALMSQGIYFGLACADATWLIILRSGAPELSNKIIQK